MMVFLLLNADHQWQTGRQKKMIVYNVPKLSAIDLVAGRSWTFIGDTILLKDGLLQNFHLKPSRISLGLGNRADRLDQALVKDNFILFGGKKILLINKPVQYEAAKPVDVDIIIISGNPKLYIPQLAKAFNCGQYVFDASNPLWKIAKWKKDCEELHLRNHTVSEQGAFILDCGK